MWIKVYGAVFFLILCSSSILSEKNNATTATLKALHILFRHGHRTTENLPDTVYPKDPYKNEKYYPFGLGQLTNKGKRRAYALGQWLRTRYNSFLGNIYNPNLMDAVSSGFNRTAASLALVLAALYPPKGTDLEWNENLNWQPVIYNQLSGANYLSFKQTTCPKYVQLLTDYYNSPKIKKKMEFHKPLLEYVQQNSGSKISELFIAFLIYDIFETQKEWGLKPPAWSEPIFPNILYGATLDYLDIIAGTRELKQYGSGDLLEKIVKDTASIISNQTVPPEKKIFIYSAHDYNVVMLQKLLEVYVAHRPSYSACVILEVHKINKVYGIKIYYVDKEEEGPKLLKMADCDYFCPFKKFYQLVKQYLPTKDMSCEADRSSYNANFLLK